MNLNSYYEFYRNEYRLLYTGSEFPTNAFFKNQYKHGKRIFQFCKKTLKFNNQLCDKLILEVGCGAGGILKYFRDQGCQVFGVDLNNKYIAYGKENYGLNLIKGSIADIPNNLHPDFIIYSHVLEHIINPKEEISLMREKLNEMVPSTLKYLDYSTYVIMKWIFCVTCQMLMFFTFLYIVYAA